MSMIDVLMALFILESKYVGGMGIYGKAMGNVGTHKPGPELI